MVKNSLASGSGKKGGAGKVPRPVVLTILDGWGHSTDVNDNAYALANTPHLDRLFDACPHALLETSGEHVGLPPGQMGNSEVGHMNIGGGRVVVQNIQRIDAAIETGELAGSDVLARLAQKTRASKGSCHVLGLLSPGGVHSHQDHLVAIAGILNDAGVPVIVHAFLDGRDTPPQSAGDYSADIEARLANLADAQFGTVCGRYYAMDRDKRWERVEQAYRCLAHADGHQADSMAIAIKESYANGITDEFVIPRPLAEYSGMADGDSLIMVNFRADRAREILTALVDPLFDGFARGKIFNFTALAGMVSYSSALDEYMPAVFQTKLLKNTLGEVVAASGLHQLRIAETEKYAHVTFFFNGGEEKTFANEDRILVPSPKVATYDLAPEMSAAEVADRLVAEIRQGNQDLIICNFANPDMVGHTGILSAAIKAMEAVDEAIGKVDRAVSEAGGILMITADHGNLEKMRNADSGQPHTAHTTGPVPVLLAGTDTDFDLRNGALCDIAPTLLALMGLQQPDEMTGSSLLTDRATDDNQRADNQASA